MRRPALEWALGLIGIVFLIVALAVEWDEIVETFEWSTKGTAAAIVSSFIGLICVSASWSVMHQPGARSKAFRRFLIVLPAKHIPGGFAQPVGVISSSAADGGVEVSTARFVRYSLVLLGGGLTLGACLVSDAATRVVGVFSLLAGCLTLAAASARRSVLMVERITGSVIRRLRRRRRDDAEPNTQVAPISNRAILAAYALALCGILGLSISFATLGFSSEGLSDPVILIGAFAVAWAVGYMSVPFPAGLAVRETVVVLILSSVGAAYGPVLAAAVLQRLCQLTAELIGVAVGYGAELVQHRAKALQS